MPSGEETDWVYSKTTVPRTHTGQHATALAEYCRYKAVTWHHKNYAVNNDM